MEDGQVLKHIDELAQEEHRLYSRENLSDEELGRLKQVTTELDQCWDLLRQRRGLRDAHANPDTAKVRPAKVVENQQG
ncbi:MAG: DUF2630 family protein [Candidatus Manganitrophus sp.]|nr:DUF2630 family protein [Candidatus Manganitrophus sp.]MDC4227588.1 DUF2630 family protein [Candidatus Manganitrophus sp.]WDT70714.1 MAG: DUF2630 family protein [Candidatus Manganitrophus sp.]WDT77039.1 MAG: DUF2630 family protein [Candidatus Manganitrophus sp.]WDT82019.1 MAG: DUF2630 family protein [Candidatus Manganitrophus sp.]